MHKVGKVVATPSNTRTSKAGRPYTIHSVVLDDGSTIELGFEQTYQVGDQFSGLVETKFGKLKLTTAVDPTPGVHVPAASAGASAPAYSAPSGGITAKDKAIIRQNALTASANVYAATLKAGAVPDPEAILGLADTLSQFAIGAWE